MKTELKAKLPTWYKDLNGMSSIITGDLDSMLGHYFISKKFDIDCSAFYNFKNIYFNEKCEGNLFGIDLDTVANESKTFGNHLTHFYKNESAINLNNYIGRIKYYQKYPLSTTILILSLYDFDIEAMTDKQLKIILAIDSAYQGFYSDKQFFKDVYLKWLDRLDIRFLEDRILKNMTLKDWDSLKRKYNLNGTIAVNKRGNLKTNIDLEGIGKVFDDIIELPGGKFHIHKSYEYKVINPNYQAIPPRDKIISMAWTFKNELKMTIR